MMNCFNFEPVFTKLLIAMTKKRIPLFLTYIVVSKFALIFSGYAQQSRGADPVISSGLDLTSRYIWRGLILTPGVAVQPHMEISGKGLTFGAWGSTTLNPHEWQEIDIYLSYDWSNFRISLFDYFFFSDQVPSINFFNYRQNETSHVLEAIAEFTGSEAIPFRFLGGVNFYGDDPHRSVYFEAAWMKTSNSIDFELFCGYTPTKGFYHESKTGFNNIGASMTRNLSDNEKFNLPLQIQLVYHPFVQKVFMVAAIGIN
jgi:hypothetical protein